jgi:hypothetical protein
VDIGFEVDVGIGCWTHDVGRLHLDRLQVDGCHLHAVQKAGLPDRIFQRRRGRASCEQDGCGRRDKCRETGHGLLPIVARRPILERT